MFMVHLSRQRSAVMIVALLLISPLVVSCNRRAVRSSVDQAAYAKDIEQWHQQRWQELSSESGWLTLVGLFWLKDGDNRCGSDLKMDVVLTEVKVPGQLGNFIVTKESVGFVPSIKDFKVEGRPLSQTVTTPLKSDAEDKPTILTYGSLSFQIIRRGDKLGLRVKDSQNSARLNFPGTEFYPTNSQWRIDGQFEAYNPPKPMPIMNVLGMESAESSPGAIKFEVNGKEYRLDAITEKNEPRFFMIIADKTTGKETYPAGRYLYVDPPDAAGHVVIDFNKAYSPPCAFTKFATCPLPPRQNRLPITIEAGEKYQPHSAVSEARP
jgi:uncharacterized protein (DUF1684 family)